MIMAKIAITKRTTLKSLCPIKKLSPVPTCCLAVNFLFAKLFVFHSIHLLRYQQGSIQLRRYRFCLEVYVKTKPDEFYSFISKVYGKENVKERVCESIALFEDISIR
jgi:hypothetical protein